MWPFSRKNKKKKIKPTSEVKRKLAGTKTRRSPATKLNKHTSGTRCKRSSCSDGPDLLNAAIAYEFIDELLDDDDDYSRMSDGPPATHNYTPPSDPIRSEPVESYSCGYESDSGDSDDF